MKKFIFGIAVVIITLIVATGFDQNDRVNGISLGEKITSFEVVNDSVRLTIGGNNDFYTLVTFWESADAASRMACTEYSSVLKNNPRLADNIRYACVNTDRNPVLFKEIVKADNLDVSRQFRLDSNNTVLPYGMFELDKGSCTVLISPDGHAVAFNPPAEMIARFVKS